MIGTFGLAGAAYREAAGAARASRDAARAQGQVRSVKSRIRFLEANMAKTMMLCETLWEILRDQHGMTEQDLHKKLYEIDMRDGVLDGKNQRKAAKCPDCGHMVSSRHPACIYCGTVIDNSVFTIE